MKHGLLKVLMWNKRVCKNVRTNKIIIVKEGRRMKRERERGSEREGERKQTEREGEIDRNSQRRRA